MRLLLVIAKKGTQVDHVYAQGQTNGHDLGCVLLEPVKATSSSHADTYNPYR
ncbi:hypothetical protein ACFL2V_04785 [Pseudomonadota bacterium]